MPNPDIARIAERIKGECYSDGWDGAECNPSFDLESCGLTLAEELAALTEYAERLRGALDELLSMTAVRDAASKASKEFMIHKRACEALNSFPADFVEIAKANAKLLSDIEAFLKKPAPKTHRKVWRSPGLNGDCRPLPVEFICAEDCKICRYDHIRAELLKRLQAVQGQHACILRDDLLNRIAAFLRNPLHDTMVFKYQEAGALIERIEESLK